MGWVWLDDLMPEHPKVMKAGPLAAWLHVCGIAYCNRHKTEGRIPKARVNGLADIANAKQQAARLVMAGLWHDQGEEYEVHDYGDYQLTQQDRQARSEAGRKGAKKRWHGEGNGSGHSTSHSASDSTRHSESHSGSHSGSHGKGHSTPHANRITTPPPTPTTTTKDADVGGTPQPNAPVLIGDVLRSEAA